MPGSIRVILVDDHQIIRQGLRSLLNAQPGLEVVAEAPDGGAAVRLSGELAPDVVVMDVDMPGVSGVEATREITRGNGHPPKVVALSAYRSLRFTADMLNAGAAGYVVKESAFSELAEAIRTVASGKVYLSPEVADVLLKDGKNRGDGTGNVGDGEVAAAPTAYSQLSPREREILHLTAEGKAMKEIAVTLDISIKTVETHRRKVMEKLGFESVAELTKYAIREGLTSL